MVPRHMTREWQGSLGLAVTVFLPFPADSGTRRGVQLDPGRDQPGPSLFLVTTAEGRGQRRGHYTHFHFIPQSQEQTWGWQGSGHLQGPDSLGRAEQPGTESSQARVGRQPGQRGQPLTRL